MEAAWKGVLAESDRLCDLHLKIKDNLFNDVIQQLKNWQKESYHKVCLTLVANWVLPPMQIHKQHSTQLAQLLFGTIKIDANFS